MTLMQIAYDPNGRPICGACGTTVQDSLCDLIQAGKLGRCVECFSELVLAPEHPSNSIQVGDYLGLAARTECDYERAFERVSIDESTAIRLVHGAVGVSGEAGEISGCIERWLFYGQELDKVNLKEEIGDMLWYLAGICRAIDYDLEQAMRDNIAKLRKRYPEKFTEELAAEENRDRQAEREVIDAQET